MSLTNSLACRPNWAIQAATWRSLEKGTQNHGVIALGRTAQEVLNTTQMLVKTCRILAQAIAAGGPRFLSPAQVERIDTRPDELARRKGFA